MANLTILGAGGMLGRDLSQRLAGGPHTLSACTRAQCDLTDPGQLRAAVESAHIIVNCAAYTAVDRAESEPDLARAVNVDAVAQIGRIAASTGAYVIHFSTDFVFDGQADHPYAETDPTAPLSVYGATKLAGEDALRQSGAQHAILRVQWTYGHHGAHFISKIRQRAEDTGQLRVVDDQIGAPTPTSWIADLTAHFIDARHTGLYHVAAAGYASRYDVAAQIIRILGLQVDLSACSSSDFVTPAARPLNSRFDCAKLDAILTHPRPHWQDALARFLEDSP